MSVLTRRWLVLLGGHQSVSGLDVVFVPERLQVASVELQNLRSMETTSAQGRLVSLLFPEVSPGKVGYVGLLTVSFTEDAPVIAAIAWESRHDEQGEVVSLALPLDGVIQAGLLGRMDERSHLDFSWSWIVSQHSIPIEIIRPEERGRLFEPYSEEDLFVVRRRAMADDERSRAFFLAMDVGTIASGVPKDWLAVMNAVNTRLAVRVEERSKTGASNRVPTWGPSARFARQLFQASTFVQTLIITHLYEGGDHSLVETAFTRFAVDAFAVSHRDPIQHGRLQSHGAPDGSAFFRFAELAFACIENNVHKAFWETHVGALVHAAHVYAEHGWELVEFPQQAKPIKYLYAYRENRRFPLRRLRILETLCKVPAKVNATKYLEDYFTSVMAQALALEGPFSVRTRELKHRATLERQETKDSRASSLHRFVQQSGLFGVLEQL